jgi:gamma-glutamyltranspeptidase/glutathione hydrolase
MVAAPDQLASEAGVAMLRAGGTAADAAIAASAVLAVTTPHMCGVGGDLWALVHPGQGATEPYALNASGHAGSEADPDQLRRDDHQIMPFAGDVRSVPIPDCVDEWCALHDR